MTRIVELGVARDRGWPVSCIAGGHLKMLVQPDIVAEEVHGLLARALELHRM